MFLFGSSPQSSQHVHMGQLDGMSIKLTTGYHGWKCPKGHQWELGFYGWCYGELKKPKDTCLKVLYMAVVLLMELPYALSTLLNDNFFSFFFFLFYLLDSVLFCMLSSTPVFFLSFLSSIRESGCYFISPLHVFPYGSLFSWLVASVRGGEVCS